MASRAPVARVALPHARPAHRGAHSRGIRLLAQQARTGHGSRGGHCERIGVVRGNALLIPSGPEFNGYNPDQLLDPALVSKQITVRNWRPGDRFWPAHTRSPKKVKELLQ